MSNKRSFVRRHIKAILSVCFSVFFVALGIGFFWIATLKMPDLNAFEARKVSQSTKIYDRTGEVLLYDVNTDVKRTLVKLEEISPLIQKAAVAIEDEDFYTHKGIKISSIIRAVFANILAGGASQGGSTITQQVVKNSLLTQDKTVTRKIKEWVLSLKLEKVLSKEQILEVYLNESPYGGTFYGVEETAGAFFGRSAQNVTLAQAAYLAAIPQAPTYYSPYGTHRDALDARQKLVLQKMKQLDMITDDEYKQALEEKVVFSPRNEANIKAPHFVMYVKDYLTQKYGEEMVSQGGLTVVTTLDYDMQKTAEDVVTRFGPSLEENYNASNTAIVAINPKNGDILTMLGSKDYFNAAIDGNYNVALAKRQPGSTFKPFVYATAFKKGFTPETVLFDVPTEFSTRCTPDGKTINPSGDPTKDCYSPDEYDNTFPGPMTIREALAHSRNIPAVKTLYLAGIADSLQTAQDMGISSLKDPNRYGLTLVLGGGEVSLLELTSAYGVFANDGVRSPDRSILKVTDGKGNILEDNTLTETSSLVIQPDIARQITDILSDPKARMTSLQPIGESIGRPVAIKTGTTNDFRDVWTLGYTPNLVVGAWAGKNDNTSMQKNIAGLIITPVWGAFMSQAVKEFPAENFKTPPSPTSEGAPVLRGIWQGGISYWKDKVSGKVATEFTPEDAKEEVIFNGVHTILHWLDKNNPLGPIPTKPQNDSQYENWEFGVRKWFNEYKKSHPDFNEATNIAIPSEKDDVHTAENSFRVEILSPSNNSVIDQHKLLEVKLAYSGKWKPLKTEVYLNGRHVLTDTTDSPNISFVPADIGSLIDDNQLQVIMYDQAYNKSQSVINFSVN